MARGIIIHSVDGLDLPLSLFTDAARDIQIRNSKNVRVIPDDQFDDVARAENQSEATPPLIGDDEA